VLRYFQGLSVHFCSRSDNFCGAWRSGFKQSPAAPTVGSAIAPRISGTLPPKMPGTQKNQQLIDVLSVTSRDVKVFAYSPGDALAVNYLLVPPAAALAMVMAHADYEWGGTTRRCRYIRPTTPPPPTSLPSDPDPRDSSDFRASDSGQVGFLRYPTPFGGQGCQFPGLARYGGGFARA
jgi:hypothetical protein